MPASPRITGGDGSRQTPTDGSRRDHGIKAKETWNLHGLCCFFLVELHQLYINYISKMASVVGKMMKNLRPNLLDFPMDPPSTLLMCLEKFLGLVFEPQEKKKLRRTRRRRARRRQRNSRSNNRKRTRRRRISHPRCYVQHTQNTSGGRWR